MEFQMNFITNSVEAKQVIVRIINEFFDSSPFISFGRNEIK
jgi:hypothetical protein